MVIERSAGTNSLVDVLDRVLDKGIIIDAWVRLSLVGIDLITVEARVVVASIATYLQYSDVVGDMTAIAAPTIAAPTIAAPTIAAPTIAAPTPMSVNGRLVGRRLPLRPPPPRSMPA